MMRVIDRFLRREQRTAGWRFLLLWIVATNLGFWPGVYIGTWVSRLIPLGMPVLFDLVLRGAVSGLFIGGAVGFMQSLILRRHIPEHGAWILATAVGWTCGVFLGGLTALVIYPDLEPFSTPYLALVGLIAGGIVGALQWPVLQDHIPWVGWWWLLISAISWAISVPGAISGLVLVLILRRRYRQIELAHQLEQTEPISRRDFPLR